MTKPDLEGLAPESWHCVDCGVNTAPGMLGRAELERAFEALEAAGKTAPEDGVEQQIIAGSEVYTVRDAVWKASGMEPYGGCLCVGCLEKRLGRKLRPKDFLKGHSFKSPRVGAGRGGK